MKNILFNFLTQLAGNNISEAEILFSEYMTAKGSKILNESLQRQTYNLLGNLDIDKLYALSNYFRVILPRGLSHNVIIRKITEAINQGKIDFSDLEKYLRTLKSTDVFNEAALPIKMVGNDVLVNNKKVGHINNDLKDPDSKIKFTDLENKNTSFENIHDLYSHLTKKFELKSE